MKYLWIIGLDSSTTIFYWHSKDVQTQVDPDLLSGLLTALNNFSKAELKTHGISSIDMGGLQWTYLQFPKNGLMYISAADRDANAEVMRSRLKVIHNMFFKKYEFAHDKKIKTIIKINQFLNFEEDMDLIKMQWEMANTQIGPAQLFDLLGIFQQVYNAIHDIIKKNFFGEELKKILEIIDDYKTHMWQGMEIPNEEYKKIVFDKESGWSVLMLNPMNLNAVNLRNLLFNILNSQIFIISNHMSQMGLIYNVDKYIFPIFLNQYDLLASIDILKPMLAVFLSVNL